MNTIKEYIAKLSPFDQERIGLVQSIVNDVAPDAAEAFSYGIPAYKIGDKYLVWFAAFKDHISIYPASDDMVRVLGKELGEHRTSPGTIQFKSNKPLPKKLIASIVRYRLKHIE